MDFDDFVVVHLLYVGNTLCSCACDFFRSSWRKQIIRCYGLRVFVENKQ